ncbi:hypothetical protein EWM64_g3251 [Hericium alpestre]|uniref:Protein kinase domain-containing protein n=1 Tax=Hericium alpestre TaxID=135208 RepID=A0A4Z0A102_9AGAM|nr:hypothetical protein EWM64_g3251 [Hericium alpestre]
MTNVPANRNALKDVDFPWIINYARNCQRELGSKHDTPAELSDLHDQLNSIMVAAAETQRVVIGPQRDETDISVRNALTHSISVCAVLLQEKWPRIAMGLKAAYSMSKDISGEDRLKSIDWKELKSLAARLKEQVQAMEVYLSSLPPSPRVAPSLEIDRKQLIAFGSGDTAVYKGTFDGRAVAVKRLQKSRVTPATKEVDILLQTEGHPNIIRFHFLASDEDDVYWYLVLDLCPATLADIVLRPDQYPFIASHFDPKAALRDVSSGLHYLHALDIVHRDIKPTNILISPGRTGPGEGAHRILISDFGLCKRLGLGDGQPLSPTSAVQGTDGWCAPEIIRGEVVFDDLVDLNSTSPQPSDDTSIPGIQGDKNRLKKSLDIFALGLLFYFTLTHGQHAFGSEERNLNILRNNRSLEHLHLTDKSENVEITDLISRMLHPSAEQRLTIMQCYMHAFFWSRMDRIYFLHVASDYFNDTDHESKPEIRTIEDDANSVIGSNWLSRFDRDFIQALDAKSLRYDGQSIKSLLRMIRQQWSFDFLPANIRHQIGSTSDDHLVYFTDRFPHLLTHVYQVIAKSGASGTELFQRYFNPEHE